MTKEGKAGWPSFGASKEPSDPRSAPVKVEIRNVQLQSGGKLTFILEDANPLLWSKFDRQFFYGIVDALCAYERTVSQKANAEQMERLMEMHMVALEREGGVWTRGRHTRGKGFEADAIKYAEAALKGWTVFRASPQQIVNGTVLGWLQRALVTVEPGSKEGHR